jgi:hypothetical protein
MSSGIEAIGILAALIAVIVAGAYVVACKGFVEVALKWNLRIRVGRKKLALPKKRP